MHIGAFLMMLLMHLHLTALEPALKEGLAIARNPAVQKEANRVVKGAGQAITAYNNAHKCKTGKCKGLTGSN
jgi:hypothetical protein